jgi:hypothetical protein
VGAADVVVLPFRRITTSSSAHLALSLGRAVILPDLEAFSDVPDDACVRFDGTIEGLAGAIDAVAAWPAAEMAALGKRGAASVAGDTWAEAAARTYNTLAELLETP